MQSDYDAILSDWIICPLRDSERSFLAGRVQGDRKGRFRDGAYIATSLIMCPVQEIVDGSVVKTENSRYLLADRNRTDDAIIAKLDAWLATYPEAPLMWSALASVDAELIAAYILREFRAAAAEAVWRRDGSD